MPEALNYVLDQNSLAYQALEEAFNKERQARDKQITRAWRYYKGDQDKPLRAQKDGYDDNVILGKIEPLADRAVSYLLGDGLTFDTGGDDSSDAGDDELMAIWDKSRGAILLNNIALEGAITGHNALLLDINPVKIKQIKQNHFSAFWHPFDMQQVLWYRLQHKSGEQGLRVDYVRGVYNEADEVLDPEGEGWTEFVYRFDNKSAVFWVLQSITEWPYQFSPIIDWQNRPMPNEYYGLSDVDNAIRLNDALNFVSSNIQRIIKQYAAPKTVGTGFASDDLIATQIGSFWTVNKPDAKIYNLEMASDLMSSMNWSALIERALWQSGSMTDPSTIKDTVGQLTNLGLRILFADTINRISQKRMLWDEAMDKANRYLLELSGMTVPDTVAVVWPEILPDDISAETQQVLDLIDRQMISQQTALDRLGYDWMKEQDRRVEQLEQGGNPGANALAALIQGNRGFNRG